MLASGTVLQNRYRVTCEIGAGGMSVVYLAEDARLAGRQCAIFGEWELIKREINWQDHWQAQLMLELSTLNSNFIVVAWHNPTAVWRSLPTAVVLADYGDTRAQVTAVVESLTGTLVPTGRLPMDLSTTLSPP